MIAIYPGTFDPITNGHIDVIKRASKIFDEIVIGVSLSKDKETMFKLKDRLAMADNALKEYKSVVVKPFENLLVNFVKDENANVVIRGLRAVSDFEYELQMGYANMSLDRDIEVFYLMPTLKNAFISSTIVRSILEHDVKRTKDMIDSSTLEYIKELRCI